MAWEGVALHAVRNKIPHLDTHSSQILTPDQRPMPRRSHFTASDSMLLEHGARKGVPGNKPGSLPKAQVFLLANGWDSKHPWGSCQGLSPPSPALPRPAQPRTPEHRPPTPGRATATAPGHEGVKRPPRWPTCFALRRGHAGGCPLPWGGCQGPAALSGAVPQAA